MKAKTGMKLQESAQMSQTAIADVEKTRESERRSTRSSLPRKESVMTETAATNARFWNDGSERIRRSTKGDPREFQKATKNYK